MTTIVTFKVSDGIVMGADSAMTTRKGRIGSNRYDSYEKLNQLGDLPVVVAMWGSALTAGRTVRSLLCEYARTSGFDSPASHRPPWTMTEIAHGLRDFIREQVEQDKNCGCKPGKLDLLVSGYSAGRFKPEQWHVKFPQGNVALRQGEEQLALTWDGVNEDIRTLWWGAHPSLERILRKHEIPSDTIKNVLDVIHQTAAWGPQRVDFTMPVRDAAGLVAFLLSVQVTAERYKPKMARSAPPLDIAIVRYDGVHWVRKKSPWSLESDVGQRLSPT